jgi:galactokinase/mevalonate kinase-like predicted kinase
VIISRTPFRISFTGGGTDLAEFYRHERGEVLAGVMKIVLNALLKSIPFLFQLYSSLIY